MASLNGQTSGDIYNTLFTNIHIFILGLASQTNQLLIDADQMVSAIA